jgi:hypothetical protein
MIIIRLNTINLCTNKLLVEILGWGRYMLCTNKWSQYWCIILRTNFVICWWHILQNLDTSLVAKLIKVRYFPRSTLFEAFLSYNPNFAWRSVWKDIFFTWVFEICGAIIYLVCENHKLIIIDMVVVKFWVGPMNLA